LWPTPRTGKTTDETEESWRKRNDAGKVATPPLSLAVKLWPTAKGEPSGPDFARANREGNGGDDLATAVARELLSTPTATERVNDTTATPSQASIEKFQRGEIARIRKTRAPALATKVLLPTPRAEDSQCIGLHQGQPDSLSALTKMLPTARSRDWKGQTQRGIHAPGDSLANQDSGSGRPIGGQLNPTWVEWLMGYPTGWTDLRDSATP
jgi:hypothetical protein